MLRRPRKARATWGWQRQGWILPSSPDFGTSVVLPTPWFWTSSLSNHERTISLFWANQFVETAHGSPRNLMQHRGGGTWNYLWTSRGLGSGLMIWRLLTRRPMAVSTDFRRWWSLNASKEGKGCPVLRRHPWWAPRVQPSPAASKGRLPTLRPSHCEMTAVLSPGQGRKPQRLSLPLPVTLQEKTLFYTGRDGEPSVGGFWLSYGMGLMSKFR